MAAPASFDRVYAALRRLQPPVAYSDAEESLALAELRAIAWVLARAVDLWEALLPGLVLDADQLLPRWERLLELGEHPADDFAVRTARVVSVLRRRLGYSRTRLASILAPAAGCLPTDLSWVEVLRSDIEQAMRFSRVYAGAGVTVGAPDPGWVQVVDVPWPGVVDDVGVGLTIRVDTPDTTDCWVRVRHASGKLAVMWAGASGSLDEVTLWERQLFAGLPARGPWRVEVYSTAAHGAAKVKDFSLFVSNADDSSQIYFGYCLRPVALNATVPIAAAQLVMARTGIAHVLGRMVERTSVLCDDAHSTTDREPVGS